MPAEKLTPWFTLPEKPTLEGWYDFRYAMGSDEYSRVLRFRWDGARFVTSGGRAIEEFFGDQWRGLAEKPR